MSMQSQGIYHVDIVMCIDATGSMSKIINDVKQTALTFHQRFSEAMEEADKSVDKLRIKVIAFRDFGKTDAPAIESSERFFTLPDENEAFKEFVDRIEAKGGGDIPENALEAISLALRSDWTTDGEKRRHVILVFTDAPALDLSARKDCPGYPEGMPADLAQLGAWWEQTDQTFGDGTYQAEAGRLVAFVPNAEPWTAMEAWNRYWPAYSAAGTELDDTNMAAAIDLLVGSMGKTV